MVFNKASKRDEVLEKYGHSDPQDPKDPNGLHRVARRRTKGLGPYLVVLTDHGRPERTPAACRSNASRRAGRAASPNGRPTVARPSRTRGVNKKVIEMPELPNVAA